MTYRVPVNSYQPNMAGYSPTTAYRSVWAPIPVTQYRPVSYVNPLSTGTQTNMMPCSTQEWQARRVPYTSYQPSSLFSGGSGWHGGQLLPVQGYGNPAGGVTAGYGGSNFGGAPVNFEQASPWQPTSPTTTNYGAATSFGAAPIASGWTAVNNDASWAAPTNGTGLLTMGNSSVRRAGYPASNGHAHTVTPLPSSVDSSWTPIHERQVTAGYGANDWRPATDANPTCSNCTSGSNESNSGAGSTDWTPVENEQTDPKRQKPHAAADVAPSLREERNRLNLELELERERLELEKLQLERTRLQREQSDDLFRWERAREMSRTELTPVLGRDEEGYRTRINRSRGSDIGVSSTSVDGNRTTARPDITQPGPYLGTTSNPVYRIPSRQQSAFADQQTQPAPYMKPIPDLNRSRQQHGVQRPQSVPRRPDLLDDADERTASVNRRTPSRRAVPIDWTPVEIDRQGRLTRVKGETGGATPSIDLTPPQNLGTDHGTDADIRQENGLENEGGWRRVR